MPQTVVPMIHVPDVIATIDWYTSIGFRLIRQNEEAGEVNWAKLSFGNSELMVNAGGKTSLNHRREVDLYILADNVDDLYRRFKDRVQVVESSRYLLRYAGVHHARCQRILGHIRATHADVAVGS